MSSQDEDETGPGSAAVQGAGGPGGSQSPQQVTRQLGSDRDHGSMSGNLGQRKSKAGPGSAAVQGAGGPGDSQSPQQVTRQLGSDRETGPGSAAVQGAGGPGGSQPPLQDIKQPGSDRDHGSMSGNLGERKSRARRGSAADHGAGDSGGSQSPQQVTRQLGSDRDHGSTSCNRGQRKSKAGSGSGAVQGAGGSKGDQDVQQVTGRLGLDRGVQRGSIKEIAPTVPLHQAPTLRFELGPNDEEILRSPLSHIQWEHIFNQRKLYDGLSKIANTRFEKDDAGIKFTHELEQEDQQWIDTILEKLNDLSKGICSAERSLSFHHLKYFEERWKLEKLSKQNHVTCLFQRCNSTGMLVILADEDLKAAEETTDAILKSMKEELKHARIKVPLPYFDDSCFQKFVRPEKCTSISVWYERKDENTHTIHLLGPVSECSNVCNALSPILTTLQMEQVKWSSGAEVWVSQEESQVFLEILMQEKCPGVHLFKKDDHFLIGRAEEVLDAQQMIQNTICTEEHRLSVQLVEPIFESLVSTNVAEKVQFIPEYYLLASFDSQRELLKLTGPKESHSRFLQIQCQISLKNPSEELKTRIQSVAPEVSLRQMEGNSLIEGPILDVEKAIQMTVATHPKSQIGPFEEKATQPRKVSRETLIKLLQIPEMKNAVDTHLKLPKRQGEGIQWRVDRDRGIEVACKDEKKCTEIENEIWDLFAEREFTVEKSDSESVKMLLKNWHEFEKKLHDFSDCLIASLDPKEKVIHLAGLRDRVDAAYQQMTHLMKVQKACSPMTIELTRAEHTYLINIHTEALGKIIQKVEKKGGTLRIHADREYVNFRITVTGSTSTASEAVKSIQLLQNKICVEEVKVSDALLACLTSTDEGKKFVESVEDKYNCCVVCPNPSPLDQRHPLSFAEGMLPGGTKVSVQQGPLRSEGVEMVALPVPVEMGQSSSSAALPGQCPELLRGLENEFTEECMKLRNSEQRVALLPPPRKTSLAKVILFKVPSEWNKGTNGEKDYMRSSVKELLELVLKEQFLSVAIDVPIHLPVRAAEKQILYVLSKEKSDRGEPFTMIKSVKLFTKRGDSAVLLSESIACLKSSRHGEGDASDGRSAHAEFAPRTQNSIAIAGPDKTKTAQAAHELSKFQPHEKPSDPLSTSGTKELTKDISKICPNLRKQMTLGPEESIEREVSSMMRKLIQCSVSSGSGKLFLHCSAQKEMLALDACQKFEAMVSLATKSPSCHSSGRSERSGTRSPPPCEFDEIFIRAAEHLFPNFFRDVRSVGRGNGKVVLSPSLRKEDQDRISNLFHEKVDVNTAGEMKKAETVRETLQMEDAYAEFIPAKGIISVFAMQYKPLQSMIHKIKVHLGQIKTTSRTRRQIITPAGNPDMDDEEASAASAFERTGETAAEATGKDNKITLPGGLEVIPYKTDITKLKVDAIVNAANERLAHGGGVARAIADAAGPDFIQECREYIDFNGPIPVSGVCVTSAGSLPCPHVIHAVGPRWDSQASKRCRQQLYDTVLNCCREADKWELREIAMPAISSSIFGMPKDQCTEMYCKALLDFDQQPNNKLKTIHFVDIKDDMPLALLKALRKEIGQGQQRTRPSEADVDLSQGCVICTEKDIDQPVKLNGCNHVFCKGCIEQWFQTKPTCPSCNKQYGIITGTMPWGTMNFHHDRYTKLAGFENCGCIVINYYVPDGVQKEEHPNPRQPYKGARRTAYLPDNAEGNKVLRLLQEAWDRKLTFTIGRSTTTGQENVVTWNDIHHKTSTVPRHPFGYPDPDYLTRVQEELAARGVTEESIRLAQSGNPQDFSQFYTPLRPQRSTNAPHFV